MLRIFNLLDRCRSARSVPSTTQISSPNAEENNEKLKNVLSKLEAFIEHVYIGFPPVGTGRGTIFRDDQNEYKNPDQFLQQMSGAVRTLDIMTAQAKYYSVALGSDLNEWNIDELNNFVAFFSVFQKYPVQITIDSKQLESWEPEKFKVFLKAAKFATVENFKISYLYGNEFHIFPENLQLIKNEFPNARVEKAKYHGNSSRPLSHRLINAWPEGEISASMNNEDPQEESKQTVSPSRLNS